MSEQAEANELVHDLRGKKIFAFEVARAQNIRDLTKAAKTQKQRIELDSASDTDPFDEQDAAEEVTDYLQQALVINSPTKATEKPANQTESDVDETLTEDSEQQRTDAQTESTPAPSAPQLENIVENNEETFSEQNAPNRRENQEIPLRPLYPLLTHLSETAQTGTKNISTKSADTSPSDSSFATSADSDGTKYNQIAPTPVANQKIIEHHLIPSYEQAEKAKMEQCRMSSLLQPPQAPAYHVPIADAIIAPKIFSGTAAESGEEWLEYLDKYFEFRHIRDEDKINLFSMLLRGGASDWMSTLTRHQLQDYDTLKEAFKETYYPSHELRYREASALWRDVQGPHEKFDDYLTRLKRAARRCQISDDLLHLAVLNGLRPNIRCQILSSGVKDFAETVRLARAAEATLSTDPVTALLLENMKTTTQIADKHSQEISDLAAKVSTLTANSISNQQALQNDSSAIAATTENEQPRQFNRSFNSRSADNRTDRNRGAQRPRGPPMRAPPPRRNNTWRNNDTRQTHSNAQQSQNTCTKCGLDHARDSCPANDQTCRKCQRIGHYARCCRSGQTRRD
jgi:hypothetical protein